MKRVAIMCRVSSDEQAKGYSLDDQRERLMQYCQRNNLEIVYEIKEDHSAKSFNRPEWNKWLALVKSKNLLVDEILFTSWDRFSRDLLGALTTIKMLRETVHVIPQSIEQPINYDIPENLFMLAIYLANPDVDNQRRSIKIRGGIRQAFKQGRWPRRAVFGYKSGKDHLGKNILIRDPEKAHFITFIFEEVLKGTSQVELRKYLKEKGIHVSRNNMSKILKRELYAGKITIPAYDKEPVKVIEGIHEPLITESTFLKVQQMLYGNKKTRGKSIPKYARMRDDFPLRGVLKCIECDDVMTASFSKGKLGNKYGYYHCNGCKKQRIPMGNVHAAFSDLLEEITIRPEVKKLYTVVLEDLLGGTQTDNKKESENLRKKLAQVEERLVLSQDLMLDGKIDSEDYIQIKARCTGQKDEIKAKIRDFNLTKRDFSNYAKSGLNLLSNLPNTYDRATVRLKQIIVGSIFPELISFDGKKCRTQKLNPVLSLFASIDKGLRENKKGQPKANFQLSPSAERGGFEPPLRYRKHAFQACAFSHSATSPVCSLGVFSLPIIIGTAPLLFKAAKIQKEKSK